MKVEILTWQVKAWQAIYAGRARLPHALLLTGPRGIGKFRFAQDVASFLLCEQPAPDGLACGLCGACGWFAEGNHPDFRLISPEAEQSEDIPVKKTFNPAIKVDQIRALGEFLSLSSHQGGKRIVLIYPADAMNAAASSALLKNLEEPPPETLFILVAQQPQRLLPTLRSRCQLITLTLPDKEISLQWLKAQDIKNPEILLAQAGLAPLLAIDMNDENYLEGRAKFLSSLSNLSSLVALEMAEQFAKVSLGWTLDWLQKWTYDLVCLKLGDEVRYSLDFVKELKGIVIRMDTLKLLRYNSRLIESRRLISHPLNAQLVLETSLFAYLDLFNQELVDV